MMDKLDDLFDTSQYCSLEGTTPDPTPDNIDFYQHSPHPSLEHPLSSSDNLYGSEFLGIASLSAPGVLLDQELFNLPAQSLALPPPSPASSISHHHSHQHHPTNTPSHKPAGTLNIGTFSSWKTVSSKHEDADGSHPASALADHLNGLPRKICSNCGSISTPSWRRCPEGRNLLCNACGLYQKLHRRPRPLRIREDGSVQVIRNIQSLRNVCQNCRTKETPIWRRSQEDRSLLLCNACALYLRNHNAARPISTDATDQHSNGLPYDAFLDT